MYREHNYLPTLYIPIENGLTQHPLNRSEELAPRFLQPTYGSVKGNGELDFHMGLLNGECNHISSCKTMTKSERKCQVPLNVFLSL